MHHDSDQRQNPSDQRIEPSVVQISEYRKPCFSHLLKDGKNTCARNIPILIRGLLKEYFPRKACFVTCTSSGLDVASWVLR